jgi:uncharacterized protein (TIGR02217 family)
MAFVEVRINDGLILYGTDGGAGYSTDIVTLNSGYESRNSNWVNGRGNWNLGDRVVVQSEADTLNKFFRARKGRAIGFRYKDWMDYQDGGFGVLATTNQTSTPTNVGTGNGNSVYQMYKSYSSGGAYEYRQIRKPVTGTTKIYRNGVLATAGGANGNYSIDTTTGLITFVNDLVVSISAITQATAGVVTTSTAHGLTTGWQVMITGVVGMTQVNGILHTVSVINATQFSIENTTTYTAYTSGGAVQKFPQSGDSLTWTGEFDVPVRFDTDKFSARFDGANISTPGVVAGGYFYVARLPIIEVRV